MMRKKHLLHMSNSGYISTSVIVYMFFLSSVILYELTQVSVKVNIVSNYEKITDILTYQNSLNTEKNLKELSSFSICDWQNISDKQRLTKVQVEQFTSKQCTSDDILYYNNSSKIFEIFITNNNVIIDNYYYIKSSDDEVIQSDFIWPEKCNTVTNGYMGYENHDAIDISCGLNSEIYAAKSGIVKDVGYEEGGYGNYILVEHYDGFATMYAHLIKPSIYKKLDNVSVGEIIGFEGSTGNSTGSHLHFEIRTINENGLYVRPYPDPMNYYNKN